MAIGGRRHRRTCRARLVAVGLLGVLALVAAACDGGTNSARRPGEVRPLGPGIRRGCRQRRRPSPSTPSPTSPTSSTPTPTGTASLSPASPTVSESGREATPPEPCLSVLTRPHRPSPGSRPRRPPTAPPAPVRPGAAWRSAARVGPRAVEQHAGVRESERSRRPRAATAPVQYVAITEGPSGRPEAHTLTVTSSGRQVSAARGARAHERRGRRASRSTPVCKRSRSTTRCTSVRRRRASGPQYWVDKVRYETACGRRARARRGSRRIAIVDSGVQAAHPDLGRTENGGAVVPGADFLERVGDRRRAHRQRLARHARCGHRRRTRDNTIGGIGGTPRPRSCRCAC